MLKKETTSMKQIFTTIFKKFMAGKINPPVMPQVVRDIQEVIKRPASGSDELAKVIEIDPVISLRLISVANSPIYRGVIEIRNVKNAIPRLGLKETLNLVIAIANKGLYETDKVQYKILMDKLWGHSLACAYGAKLIAQNLKLEDPENFFLMGLTHDIGKILLLKAFAGVSKQKRLNMDAIMANIQEAHISLGSLLVKRWGFDDKFIDVITHHEDTNFSEDAPQEILVVHLANMLTRILGFSLFEEEVDFTELQSAQILKIAPETIESIGQELKQILQSVAHLF
jgi:putative nucleotidyltransferase with HDIG domain